MNLKEAKSIIELQSTVLRTVVGLIECRDNIIGDHIGKTQRLLSLLLDLLVKNGVYAKELSSLDIPLLIMSSQLHDIGKICIRDGILMKQGKLTFEEFEEMKKHTTYGVDIIRRIDRNATTNDFLQYAEVFAGSHHERWDGTGYPIGLSGQDIPLLGRLMAIIDVYDALVSDRSYKEAFSHETAVDIIKNNLGTQFDMVIGKVFADNHSMFKDTNIENISQ